jgi:hypothetical protein
MPDLDITHKNEAHPEPRQAERRAGVRLPSRSRVFCQTASAGAQETGWPAAVRDVSHGGICLILPCRLTPGTTLRFDVESRRSEGFMTLRARVVHATSESGGYWRTGCQFLDRPGPKEMKALLEPVPQVGAAPRI